MRPNSPDSTRLVLAPTIVRRQFPRPEPYWRKRASAIVTDPTPDPPTRDMNGTGIDATVPHSARIWNFWLGGKDNYEVDRIAGEAWAEKNPEIWEVARESRAFIGRVVTYLAADAGIRQFLDVGTGLPTADNTHEVAQRVAPDARVVYVDNDPLVLAHARALLVGPQKEAVHYLDADIHDPAAILARAQESLDFTQPVALMFMGVLGHVADLDHARAVIRTLFGPLCRGSYLAIYDGTHTVGGEAVKEAEQEYAATGAVPYITRTPPQIRSLFPGRGVKWVQPGFVSVPFWRPSQPVGIPTIGSRSPRLVDTYGGVVAKL
jgi:hypothetical protein